MTPKIAIYTAITNNYDELKEPSINHFVDNSDIDFHVFTDGVIKDLSEYTWKLRACTLFTDPCLNAKMHKILPHRFFPYAEYSLWIDGSIELLPDVNIQNLIDTYLKDADICVFKHPHRNCVYEEAKVCIESGLDKEGKIKDQIDWMKWKEYPESNGLYECGVILRKHSSDTNIFNEMWWEEINRYSKRDQLSFPFSFNEMPSVGLSTFPGHLSTNDNNLFKVHPHNPK